jgi:hypothetical protein
VKETEDWRKLRNEELMNYTVRYQFKEHYKEDEISVHIGRREKLNLENVWSQILNRRHHLGS